MRLGAGCQQECSTTVCAVSCAAQAQPDGATTGLGPGWWRGRGLWRPASGAGGEGWRWAALGATRRHGAVQQVMEVWLLESAGWAEHKHARAVWDGGKLLLQRSGMQRRCAPCGEVGSGAQGNGPTGKAGAWQGEGAAAPRACCQPRRRAARSGLTQLPHTDAAPRGLRPRCTNLGHPGRAVRAAGRHETQASCGAPASASQRQAASRA